MSGHEVFHHFHRKRYGSANFQHRHVFPSQGFEKIHDHRKGNTSGNDPQLGLLCGGDFVVVRSEILFEILPDGIVFLVQFGMIHPNVGGKADPAPDIFFEIRRPVQGEDLSELHILPAVIHPARGAQHYGNMVGFRKSIRIENHALRLLRRGGIETGNLGIHGKITAVLLGLRAMRPRIVRHRKQKPTFKLEMSHAHESVRRHVEPHLLHDRTGAFSREGCRSSHLESHFFVGAPLHGGLGFQLVRILGHRRKDLRGRSSRIGHGDFASRLHNSPGNGFIAKKNGPFTHVLPLLLFGK